MARTGAKQGWYWSEVAFWLRLFANCVAREGRPGSSAGMLGSGTDRAACTGASQAGTETKFSTPAAVFVQCGKITVPMSLSGHLRYFGDVHRCRLCPQQRKSQLPGPNDAMWHFELEEAASVGGLMRQRRGLRLILFSQTVPKTLGAVSLSASGNSFRKLGSFPSAGGDFKTSHCDFQIWLPPTRYRDRNGAATVRFAKQQIRSGDV